MKRIIKSIAIGVSLAVAMMWVVPVDSWAGEIKQSCYTWTTTTGQDIGHNPQSAAAVASTPFRTPMSGNYSIFVIADTAGAASASDTISIAYQVGVNRSAVGTLQQLKWKTVSTLRMPKSSATKSFPMFRMYRDGFGSTASDTNGVGVQVGSRDLDPIINTTASNEHLQWGVEPALSTGLGRFVLYGADADSLITGAWSITACFNYEENN